MGTSGLAILGLLICGLPCGSTFLEDKPGQLVAGLGYVLMLPFLVCALIAQFVVQAPASASVRK